MTLLDALAAAVRDRLLAGAPAPLPGLGTLGRAHVAARVHTAADGSRVLLPPGVALGLSPAAADPTDLAHALVRLSGAPPEAAAAALRDAVDQLDARLAITGEARLGGVGVFQRTSSGLRFAAAADLLAAVNRPFEGLAPVPVAAATGAPPPVPEPPTAPPLPAPLPPVEPGAVDILLDLIVNEPAEASRDATPEDAKSTTPDAESPASSTFADDGDDDDGDAVAVPFGVADGAPDLRTTLPPTPPDRDPAYAPDAAGWTAPDRAVPDPAPRPLDSFGDDAEDADVVSVSERRAASVEPEANWPDAPFADAPLVDVALAADGAAGLSGAEPLFAGLAAAPPSPDPTPDAATRDAETPDVVTPDTRPDARPDRAVAPRPARRAWAFLYLATVLALAALVVWWAVEERRADPGATTALRPQ